MQTNNNIIPKALHLKTEHIKLLMTVDGDYRYKIMDAVYRYYLNGEEPTDDQIKVSLFATIKSQIDKDRLSYKLKVEANQKNGKKGGRPKKSPTQYTSSAYQPSPSPQNQTQGATIVSRNGQDYAVQFGKEYPLPKNYASQPQGAYWDDFNRSWTFTKPQ